MQIKRKASAHWVRNGKDGKGGLTTQSGVLTSTQYGYKSRFEDGIGTNPEELIGAALAGCYSMKLAFNLQAIHVVPTSIDTDVEVILENGAINEIILETSLVAPGLTAEEFEKQALDAKENCPISKLLNAKIHFTFQLK